VKALEPVKQYLDALTLRERVIVLLAVILVLYGLWYLLWFSAASAQVSTARASIESTREELHKTDAQIEQFSRAGGSTAARLKRDLARAQQQLTATEQQLSRTNSALINADQLTLVLQEMLAESRAVTLLELVTLPVQVERLDTQNAEQLQPADDTGVQVYRHTVLLTVRGRYFEVLDLLDQLEAKPWRFYWQSLRYEVQHYPDAKVQIRVYSLSAEEGLLGV
jgi:MSHA biogenesis protein MshJ